MKYVTPAGTFITGTSDSVLCTANVIDFNEDGTPNHTGDTEVHWDTQEQIIKEGQPMFVCEDGNEWPLSELRLVPDDYDPDEEDDTDPELAALKVVAEAYEDGDDLETINARLNQAGFRIVPHVHE